MTNEMTMKVRNLLKIDDSFKAQVEIAKSLGIAITEVTKIASLF